MEYLNLNINLRFKIKWYLIYHVFIVNMNYAHGPFKYLCFLTKFRVQACTQKQSLKSLFNLIVPCYQLPVYICIQNKKLFHLKGLRNILLILEIYIPDLEYLHLCLHLFLKDQKRNSRYFHVSGGKEQDFPYLGRNKL